MPTIARTPSPAEASKVWTRGFAAAAREAANNENLTQKEAEAMTGMYADNARNYFEATGKRWAKVDTVIESAARYSKAAFEQAAGNNKLSLAEIRTLPADLRDDMLILRGKAPMGDVDASADTVDTATLEAAIAGAGHADLYDYGHYFDLSTFDKANTREDVLREVIAYDVDDSVINDMFSGTETGAAAARRFAASLAEEGAELAYDWDDFGSLTGAQVESRYNAVADAAQALFEGAGVKDVQFDSHFIEEDGDSDYLILMGRKSDDSWVVVSYQNFPF